MITLNQARRIAGQFGIVTERTIKYWMDAANNAHGYHGMSAEDYFRSYMEQNSFERHADEMSLRQFHCNAFGE